MSVLWELFCTDRLTITLHMYGSSGRSATSMTARLPLARKPSILGPYYRAQAGNPYLRERFTMTRRVCMAIWRRSAFLIKDCKDCSQCCFASAVLRHVPFLKLTSISLIGSGRKVEVGILYPKAPFIRALGTSGGHA